MPRGWEKSEHFARVAHNAERCEALIASLVGHCLTHGFDGVDYDWEHPRAGREVEDFADQDCPAAKITLGIPFYGRNAQREARAYAHLVHVQDVAPDTDELDGYAFNGPGTAADKTRHALDQRLAGVMVWELTQDAPGGRSLLSAIARVMEEHAASQE